MASVGPLEAWWSKKARMSARRRDRVRPSWAISSNPGRHATANRFDQSGHCLLAATPVRIGVGGDDFLIDQPGDLDREVFVAVKHLGQPGVLARGEQLHAGSGDARDPIKRVAGVSAPVTGLLLDPLADQVELGPGQGDDVEGVHDGDASGMTLVAAVL